jgi:hypothetical protein
MFASVTPPPTTTSDSAPIKAIRLISFVFDCGLA